MSDASGTEKEGHVHANPPPLPEHHMIRYKEHLRPDGNHLRRSDVGDPSSPHNQSRWTRQQSPGLYWGGFALRIRFNDKVNRIYCFCRHLYLHLSLPHLN